MGWVLLDLALQQCASLPQYVVCNGKKRKEKVIELKWEIKCCETIMGMMKMVMVKNGEKTLYL